MAKNDSVFNTRGALVEYLKWKPIALAWLYNKGVPPNDAEALIQQV